MSKYNRYIIEICRSDIFMDYTIINRDTWERKEYFAIYYT